MAMEPDDEHGYSDVEVEQVRVVVEEGFKKWSEWIVVDVTRRSGQISVVDVTIENVQDHRVLTFELHHEEFEGEVPNSSRLTNAVFNISIRLIEFLGIRGLSEFKNGDTFSLEIYPEDQRIPVTPDPATKGDWVAYAPLRSEDL